MKNTNLRLLWMSLFTVKILLIFLSTQTGSSYFTGLFFHTFMDLTIIRAATWIVYLAQIVRGPNFAKIATQTVRRSRHLKMFEEPNCALPLEGFPNTN